MTPVLTHSLSGLAELGFQQISTAIGVFDGVHAGHRKVLAELKKIANATKSIPVAVTFDPHPRQVLSGHTAPPLLLPLSERIRILGELGAEVVSVIHFTRDFSILTPEDFLDRLLSLNGNCKLCGLCVGSAWRFGFKAAGTCEDIRKRAEKDHFLFSPVPELMIGDKTVSSSAIRISIAAGNLREAEQMLGRRYTLSGKVVHGMHLAGPKLDHPTANLHIEAGVLPPFGVYAVLAMTDDGKVYPAVASIGLAPTIRNGASIPRIEVHLLDFNGDLYGKELTVELVEKIRPEQKFNSIDALKAQIFKDTDSVRSLLSKEL